LIFFIKTGASMEGDRIFEFVRHRLMYILSLPERTIRSLAAILGGTSTLLAETLFPKSLGELHPIELPSV
jgi:hypothetical protein